MNLSKLYSKTKRGETLTEAEIDILAKKLGLTDSILSLSSKIISTVIVLVTTVILMFVVENDVLKVLITILAVSAIFVIFLMKWNTRKIVSYLEVVKEFYIDRLCEYEGFENVLVQHQYVKNGYLQNNLAIFATDGYDFYIFDDLLKETKYLLPKKFKAPNNKRPALKVFDQEFVRKRPVCFHANEIKYYQVYKPYLGDAKEKETYGYEYRRYTYTITSNVLDNYCLLELNDGSTFKFSPEVVLLLRKKARKKERE
jgi:hypothetical protein